VSAVAEPERRPAPFGRRRVEVLERRRVGAYHVLAAAEGRDVPAPDSGQFYMLASTEGWGGGVDERPFLGRAFSVLRVRDTPGAERVLEFLLEDVGPGTGRLCALAEGQGLWLLGPLGHGFAPPPAGTRALLTGGGVGIAPLAIWQDELRARGAPQLALLGFRDRAHAAGAQLLVDARLATDDGSVGHHGLVTELLERELDGGGDAIVYACGPPPMLEAVRRLCQRRGVPAQLALEAGMACGFGACFGCVVAAPGGGYLRVCVDGPVLDARRLDSALAAGHP
jgi:dihydroorotate dehydrogenase electron transfer subunit